MHFFFSAGEPSGDQHAARLIAELQRRTPDVRISGFGGPRMEAAGCRLLFPLTTMAVMGLLSVLPLLWKFAHLLWQARRFLREERPDAVVLVDFPGFNMWIARIAKGAGIPVYYYLPPQLWAWAPWRVRRVRKYVDHVISGLPFETDWYAERGIPVTFVGHPFFDEVAEGQLDGSFCSRFSHEPGPLVALLPGSRTQEVLRNWPLMVEVAGRLAGRHPDVRFLVACYKESHRLLCQCELDRSNHGLPIKLFVGRTSELIDVADCGLMVSGSVSLELLARETPAAVIYRAGWATYLIGRMLVTCRYASLPNLLADRELMPEVITVGNPRPAVSRLTGILTEWLGDPAALTKARAEMRAMRQTVSRTGATAQAADVILERLDKVKPKRAA